MPNGPMLRAQVTADPVTIARLLISMKLARQAETCFNYLDSAVNAREIRRQAAFLDAANSIKSIQLIEAVAAKFYFKAWSDLSIRFNGQVPTHWKSFHGRISSIGRGNKHASDPINAMLNYAYRMLEIEGRLACIAAGLNPTLGFIHSDRYDRDSMVMDLIEAVRPEADQFILGLIADRRFSAKEFKENRYSPDIPAGTVRLVAPLTHIIAEHSVTFSTSLYRMADSIAGLICGSSPARPRDLLSDAVLMRRPSPVIHGSPAEMLPDELWSLISSLVDSLPWPVRTSVSIRSVIAVLLFARSRRMSRYAVAPVEGIATSTLERRWAEWKDLEAWHKLETVVSEYHS